MTSSVHTINSGSSEVLRLDVFVSDHALTQVNGVSTYGGSSFDLIIDLPDTIFNFDGSDYSFVAHNAFFYADAEYYQANNTIKFAAFSDAVFTDNDKPILSIDVLVDDLTSLAGKSGNVKVDLARMSEVFIPATDDVLNMVYTIELDDLILTPFEQTV